MAGGGTSALYLKNNKKININQDQKFGREHRQGNKK